MASNGPKVHQWAPPGLGVLCQRDGLPLRGHHRHDVCVVRPELQLLDVVEHLQQVRLDGHRVLDLRRPQAATDRLPGCHVTWLAYRILSALLAMPPSQVFTIPGVTA